jgi:hypothetical protein
MPVSASPTPVAAAPVAYGLIAREDHRLRAGADGVQTPATADDQRANAAGFADDASAGRDVQRGPRLDEHCAAQHVVEVVGPGLAASNAPGNDDDRLVDARNGYRRRLVAAKPGHLDDHEGPDDEHCGQRP